MRSERHGSCKGDGLMAGIGINVPADGSVSVEELKSLWVRGIRIVAEPQYDLRNYLRQIDIVGIDTLLVIARESGTDYSIYQKYRGVIAAIQTGNEPDGTGESSWAMSQDEFVALGRQLRTTFPNTPIVAGGLCSGHPSWLDGVPLDWCDYLGLHLYLKNAIPNDDLTDIWDTIAQYSRFGKPIVLSEWGWWGDNEDRASIEVESMITWVGHTDIIDSLFYFCHSDRMVAPFGLYDSNLNIKSRGEAFINAAGLYNQQTPFHTRKLLPIPMPEFDWKESLTQILNADENGDLLREALHKLLEEH